jgi:hypothetical protein
MLVQDFVQRISHLNDLMEYTPVPDPNNSPSVQTPKFTNAELSRIVQNGCLTGWKKAQIQTHHLILTAQTRYYTCLKSVKPDNPRSHCNKSHYTKVSNLCKNEIKISNPTDPTNTVTYMENAII